MKKLKQICSMLVVIIILNMAFMPVINANEVALLAAASENMYGDANEDGLINMQDVTKVERIILEYDEPTETADANEDGMINILDVTHIELIILGRIPHPGEEYEGEIEIIEDTDSSKIVQVGDILITMELDSEYTEATIHIENSETQEEEMIEYKVEKDSSEYKTEVYSEGEYIDTYITEYNPLEPIETEDEVTTNQIQASGKKVLIYIWDDVFFIQGDGIKYPHPDYSIYPIDHWETEEIEGEKLIHHHFSRSHSTFYAGTPPILVFSIIAAAFALPVLAAGAVTPVLVGSAATSGFISAIYSIEFFIDETGCMWVWYPKDFKEDYNYHFTPTPYSVFTFLPDYLRISSITAWDYMDIGDP